MSVNLSLFPCITIDYVGLGRCREWKKIEFPKKVLYYGFGSNKAER
jgi:hypothetical protein